MTLGAQASLPASFALEEAARMTLGAQASLPASFALEEAGRMPALPGSSVYCLPFSIAAAI